MTYLWVNLVVLAVCAVVAVVCMARVGSGTRRRAVVAAGIALAVSCVFTAVFDSLIIGAGIVGYDASQLVGLFVGLAPVEDFAYTIAAAVVLPALWVVLRHGAAHPHDSGTQPGSPHRDGAERSREDGTRAGSPHREDDAAAGSPHRDSAEGPR